jgi:transposase
MAGAIGLRGDDDAGALRAAAKRTKDGPQARRLLALAAIYDGATRTEAAKIGGVGLQVIGDWVLKFDAHADATIGPKPEIVVSRRASSFSFAQRTNSAALSRRRQLVGCT